jgi:hypothetical protein
MNRARLMWCLLPGMALFASLSVCLPQSIAQKALDRNQADPGQTAMSWESSAKSHQTIGQEKGTLMISDQGIEFRSQKGRSVKWPFAEVQSFLLSPQRLTIETYENRKHHIPGMQRFRFDLDQAVPPKLAAELSEKIRRPSQNAVPDPESQGIVIPAHHRTLTGGTNGTLRLSDGGIDYVTGARGDSRSWRWDDLQTLSDPDPFHLLVFGYRDTYTFDLKEPLSRSVFYRMVNALDAHNAAEPGQRPDPQSPNSAEKPGQGGRHE